MQHLLLIFSPLQDITKFSTNKSFHINALSGKVFKSVYSDHVCTSISNLFDALSYRLKHPQLGLHVHKANILSVFYAEVSLF